MKTPDKNMGWIATLGGKWLPEKRSVKPTGRLYINGKYLTVEQTSNYLRTTKKL